MQRKEQINSDTRASSSTVRKKTKMGRAGRTNWTLIEGWLSIAVNLILFGLKLWVGLLIGSIALTADAYHTLTDSLSSGIVVFSGWLSAKPADAEHPFGHGRSDLVCSVIIGVLLALVGFEFIVKSIEQLRSQTAVHYGMLAIAITIISIVTKEAMAQFAFWAGRKTDNPILKADGWHHRTDGLSSVVVLVGIMFSSFFWWMDGVLGIIVALLIFYASYQILDDSIDRLIGEQPDKELLDKIITIIDQQIPEGRPHHFHLHRYGDHIELTFHITMAPNINLQQAHDHAHLVELALREQLEIEATIHMEPEGT